jgi:hypothetical protein
MGGFLGGSIRLQPQNPKTNNKKKSLARPDLLVFTQAGFRSASPVMNWPFRPDCYPVRLRRQGFATNITILH